MRQHSMSPPAELGSKKVHTITRDHAARATEDGSGAIIVIEKTIGSGIPEKPSGEPGELPFWTR